MAWEDHSATVERRIVGICVPGGVRKHIRDSAQGDRVKWVDLGCFREFSDLPAEP